MGRHRKSKGGDEAVETDSLSLRATAVLRDLNGASPQKAAEMASDVCNLIRDLVHERRNGYSVQTGY